MSAPDVTEDALLNGRVRLRQPREGFRANLDTVLLGAAAGPAERFLDAGCGTGGVLLVAAAHHTGAAFVGLERDPAMAALARDNAALNGVAAEIVTGDVLDRALPLGTFGAVLCNPPFDKPGTGRAPAPARAAAHVAEAPIGAWIAALADRLAGGGTLTLIHRADALGDVLAGLSGRLGGVQVRPLHPRAGAAARRVLVRAVKGSRAPLLLLPGLDLHENERFTPFLAAVLAGEAAIPWG